MAAAPAMAWDVNQDYISALPYDILSEILSRLGTAEAARTAVLSTRWRHAWFATHLRLDDLEIPVPSRGRISPTAPWTARADAVTRALASHPGPVAHFRLSRTTFRGRVPAVEAWFRDLVAKGVREVSLRCPPDWCHSALADPLLGCPTLQSLALGECRISDAGASSAAAAAFLTELTLSRTHLSEPGIQSVLSGCPALRSVMLKHVQGPRRIRVCSCQSLVMLAVWHYKGLEEITVEDAPRLERLLGNVGLSADITVHGAPKLTALGYVVMKFREWIIGEPAPKVVGRGVLAPIPSIKILAISVKFSRLRDMEEVIGLLKLFRNLEILHIKSSDTKYDTQTDDTVSSLYSQELDPLKYALRHLKSARLESKCENPVPDMLAFACFLLARAPVLQVMRIQSEMADHPEWLTFQQDLLSQSHVASLEAEVVVEGLRCGDNMVFSAEAVNALADPFDSEIDIFGRPLNRL